MDDKIFLFVKNEWLEKLSVYNKHIPHNYEFTSRPYFFSFRDTDKSDIMWLIPISSKVNKFKNIRDKLLKKNGRCYNFHFANVKNVERCFEIQDIFPALDKFIDGTYNLSNGSYVKISHNDEVIIEKLGKKVIAMAKRGIKTFASDIKGMYNATIAELMQDKAQAAKTTSTPAAKVPATVGAATTQPTGAASASGTPQSNDAASQPNPTTAQPSVSAAAASMLGNMPTVQAQNPQSVHTTQNKNDNIND